ncbi:MAG: Mu transposase C-terminal domain-containing protein [Azonexus sp.]
MRGSAMVKQIGVARGPVVVMPTAQVLALRQRDPWREATDRARQVALCRESVVCYVQALTDSGVTQNNAVGLLLERGRAGNLPSHVAIALLGTARGERSAPSRSAVCDWCALYREGGISALLPDHKGRVVEVAGWWGPALEYFNAPSKPDMSAVHRRLVEVDHFAVSYDQVRGYLTGVPAMYGRNSPARIGKNLYKLTEKAFIRRSVLAALPGDILAADGYCADVYLAHPLTGGLWRPELTVCIDVRSGFVPYWRADEHEGTYAVQNMWAETFTRWNHTPIFLYVDNGSGHKNRLMSDENIGFYKRAGIVEIIHALPGNPHGKGWIERFFRSMKDDFLKLEFPAFYCGSDASSDALKHVVNEVRAGRLEAPSLAEFTEKFNAWLMRYHGRPSPAEPRRTRAEVWGELQPIPPADSVKELKRQATELTVRRASVKHYRREYGHPDLHAFNGQKLVMEYDLVDASFAVMRTLDGRWICDAPLIKAIDVIAPNRLEEARQMRADNAIKRLEKKMVEQQARAGRVIDAEAIADAASLEGHSTRLLAEDASDEIDIFD